MKTTLKRQEVPFGQHAQSSIWNKWEVDGMTSYPEDLSLAEITVTRTHSTAAMIEALALAHEHGHVFTVDNMLDNGGDADVMRAYDRWQGEIEAWIRGVDDANAAFTDQTGAFALDCLNTYRRSLGVSEADWEAGRAIIADMAISERVRDYLLSYVPEEPMPNEPPPDCQTVRPAEDGDDEAGDDEGEGDDDDEGDEPEPEEGDEQVPPDEGGNEPFHGGDDRDEEGDWEHFPEPDFGPPVYDSRWLAPDVMAALERDGVDITAAHYKLDPRTMPPLARVIADEGGAPF